MRLLHLRHRRACGRAARPASRTRTRPTVVAALDRNLCRCGVQRASSTRSWPPARTPGERAGTGGSAPPVPADVAANPRLGAVDLGRPTTAASRSGSARSSSARASSPRWPRSPRTSSAYQLAQIRMLAAHTPTRPRRGPHRGQHVDGHRPDRRCGSRRSSASSACAAAAADWQVDPRRTSGRRRLGPRRRRRPRTPTWPDAASTPTSHDRVPTTRQDEPAGPRVVGTERPGSTCPTRCSAGPATSPTCGPPGLRFGRVRAAALSGRPAGRRRRRRAPRSSTSRSSATARSSAWSRADGAPAPTERPSS